MKKIINYKDHEIFSQLRIPADIPVVIRCDGRNFHRLSEELKLQKPFDKCFAESMVSAAKEVYREGFDPVLIYTFSDEMNFVFISELPFNRRLEKIISIIPSIISSKLALMLKSRLGYEKAISFDARAIPLAKENIVGYLQWRQSEAWRNCVNSYAYYALIQKGYTPRSAAKKLEGLKYHERHDLVFKLIGVNLNNVPAWQRRGVLAVSYTHLTLPTTERV